MQAAGTDQGESKEDQSVTGRDWRGLAGTGGAWWWLWCVYTHHQSDPDHNMKVESRTPWLTLSISALGEQR